LLLAFPELELTTACNDNGCDGPAFVVYWHFYEFQNDILKPSDSLAENNMFP
jgi:hypothetical protein